MKDLDDYFDIALEQLTEEYEEEFKGTDEYDIDWEPNDETVWNRATALNEAARDDWGDALHEQRRDERNGL